MKKILFVSISLFLAEIALCQAEDSLMDTYSAIYENLLRLKKSQDSCLTFVKQYRFAADQLIIEASRVMKEPTSYKKYLRLSAIKFQAQYLLIKLKEVGEKIDSLGSDIDENRKRLDSLGTYLIE